MTDPAGIAAGLKGAMRRMPATVALITTRDPSSGAPAGLAASAVIPVSMDPPSMLISINRSASAHKAIEQAGRFCINLLGTEQTALVGLFSDSTMRDQRFTSDAWTDASGLPALAAACATIVCEVRHTAVFGTHELFIGEAVSVSTEEGAEPLGWFDGAFAKLGRL